MKLQLRFFASVREKVGCSTMDLDLADEKITANQVRQLLITRGSPWDQAFASDKVLRMALNQNMIADDTDLRDGDELAFFPPVTGG